MASVMCALVSAPPLLPPPPDPPPRALFPDLPVMLSPPKPPDPPDPPDCLSSSFPSLLFPDLKVVQGLRFLDLDVVMSPLEPFGGTLIVSLRFFPAVCSLCTLIVSLRFLPAVCSLFYETYNVARLERSVSSLSLSCLLAVTSEGSVSLLCCFILELLVLSWNMLSVLLQFLVEDVMILFRLRLLLPQYEAVRSKLSIRLPLYEAVICNLKPRSANDFVVSSFMEYRFPSNSSFMECVLPSLVFMLQEVYFFRRFSMEKPALMAIVDARRGQEAQMYHLTTLTLPWTICKEALKCWLNGAWHAHSPQDEWIFQGSPFRPYVFSVFVAEVFGLKTVMISTKALGVSRLACVSDCQELVLLNSGGHANECYELVLDISSILLQLIYVSCYHVSLAANVLTDSLVNSVLLSCNASSYGV